MKKFFFVMLLAAASTAGAYAQMGGGQNNPMVGGAAMYRTRNIVENAVNSKDHTTLVAAVKAAGLWSAIHSRDSSRDRSRVCERYPRTPVHPLTAPMGNRPWKPHRSFPRPQGGPVDQPSFKEF